MSPPPLADGKPSLDPLRSVQCSPIYVLVPIRSWTWTLRLPVNRHKHLPYHTMGVLPSTQPVATLGSSFIWSSFDVAIP